MQSIAQEPSAIEADDAVVDKFAAPDGWAKIFKALYRVGVGDRATSLYVMLLTCHANHRTGNISPGPSRETMAKVQRVNPRTIDKALRELERAGLITTRQGRGPWHDYRLTLFRDDSTVQPVQDTNALSAVTQMHSVQKFNAPSAAEQDYSRLETKTRKKKTTPSPRSLSAKADDVLSGEQLDCFNAFKTLKENATNAVCTFRPDVDPDYIETIVGGDTVDWLTAVRHYFSEFARSADVFKEYNYPLKMLANQLEEISLDAMCFTKPELTQETNHEG